MTGVPNGNGNGNGNGEGERLDSWKAIAAYLDRDAGTVRRWERTRGLPVHRVRGGKGSSVFAYTAEIDAWLLAAPLEAAVEETLAPDPPTPGQIAPLPPATPRGWRWAAGALALVSAFVLGWTVQRPSANAGELRVTMTEQALTAEDADGRELWVHRLDEKYRHIKTGVSEPVRVMPGPDPRVYYLTSQRIGRSDNTADGGEFTSLDLAGRTRFTFRFLDNLLFAGQSFGEPWAPTAFSILDGEPRRLAVAAHHWVWSPSLIAILDDTGHRLGTYVSHGWIEQLHWLSRDRLAFGGFLESKNGGMVGLLDPSQLDGQAPEPSGTPHHCGNCGQRPPLRMVVMPRTEVNLASHSRFNRAILERTNDRLIVRTVEAPGQEQGAADAIYEFTHELEFISASFSQRYWEMHDQLEAEKKIDHGRATCPDRNGPRLIRQWLPDQGWREQPIS